MIYLIDDNRRSQQKEYGCDYLQAKTYNHILEPVYILTAVDDISRFENASCILLHESFPDFNAAGQVQLGNTAVAEKVRGLAREKNIPIVIFSNGFIEIEYTAVKSSSITGMNKRLMYRNLKDFLDNFVEEQRIELRILIYGKNFIYKELLFLYSRIASVINSGELEGQRKKVELLVIRFAELCNSKDKVAKAFAELEMHAFLKYLEKIINAVNKYGVNIYN
ncbi:hypothetical protein GM921_09640 [Pedobacter sp. LMG 31464]|uniref:Uncharacterized protein n=1 Tax=Pedobacter planticolens TaxID=2679964 RepID=A0A923DZQ0_9SPHI|nr:hypothetical protein [Pedobacter planticolens]MBB2145748.1 hypothetical protein [Pedobacter planticolens]